MQYDVVYSLGKYKLICIDKLWKFNVEIYDSPGNCVISMEIFRSELESAKELYSVEQSFL